MTRLAATFAKGPALVAFITAGDPTPGATGAILDALVAGGADVIELGMPFTDPMADGPAIQQANLRSLGAGTTTADLFQIATDFRARHPQVPLVLMGYANPMITRGADWFADQCSQENRHGEGKHGIGQRALNEWLIGVRDGGRTHNWLEPHHRAFAPD